MQLPVFLGKLVGIDRQRTGSGAVAVAVALALLLVFQIQRHAARPDWPLSLALPFGVAFLLCAPIILLDGGWIRVMAASAPTLFMLLSLLVATPGRPFMRATRLDRIAALSPVVMIVVLIVAPSAARRLSQSPDTSCVAPGRLVLAHPSEEPTVLLGAEGASGRNGVPVIAPERLAALRLFANNPLVLSEPPSLRYWAYDYASHRLFTLVAPPGLLETRGEFVWVETTPLGPPDTHRRVERFGDWGACDP